MELNTTCDELDAQCAEALSGRGGGGRRGGGGAKSGVRRSELTTLSKKLDALAEQVKSQPVAPHLWHGSTPGAAGGEEAAAGAEGMPMGVMEVQAGLARLESQMVSEGAEAAERMAQMAQSLEMIRRRPGGVTGAGASEPEGSGEEAAELIAASEKRLTQTMRATIAKESAQMGRSQAQELSAFAEQVENLDYKVTELQSQCEALGSVPLSPRDETMPAPAPEPAGEASGGKGSPVGLEARVSSLGAELAAVSQRTDALSAEVVAATQRAESVEASAEALALAATAAAQNGHAEQADAHAVRHLANVSSLASGSHLGLARRGARSFKRSCSSSRRGWARWKNLSRRRSARSRRRRARR